MGKKREMPDRAFVTLIASTMLAAAVHGCSNFALERSSSYRLSVRTKDLTGAHDFAWMVVPRGRRDALGRAGIYGYVGAIETTPNSTYSNDTIVSAGLNEAGLSCDTQTLIGTRYPTPSGNVSRDLRSLQFCRWALAQFSTVSAMAAALDDVTVWGWDCAINPRDCKHVAVRDAKGDGVVIEFLNGLMQVYPDGNDGGKTGYGVMTNEPPYPWQLENVRHNAWKRSLARSAVATPGAFYPDERFLRLVELKAALPQPPNLEAAISGALHVLNSVTVPPGLQHGTDSPAAGTEHADHTVWACIYDHQTPALYWRSTSNQGALQRLRLADANLTAGAQRAILPIENTLPKFVDAAAAFRPMASPSKVIVERSYHRWDAVRHFSLV